MKININRSDFHRTLVLLDRPVKVCLEGPDNYILEVYPTPGEDVVGKLEKARIPVLVVELGKTSNPNTRVLEFTSATDTRHQRFHPHFLRSSSGSL